MKLRCLFAVKDVLHDYAEAVHTHLLDHLAARPLAVQELGAVQCAVLHRTQWMQAELIQIQPGKRILPHAHPGVDSIDLLVSGNVSGFRIGEYHVKRFIPALGLRIGQSVTHGGEIGPEGVAFLSCQRWSQPPSHITLAWRGRPINDAHERLLDELEALV